MRTTAVVIGAGQAGLAMSWWLAARSIDHVVLERGEVANTWRTERWDSLTLLTPNWQSRLPGHGYEGDDPDGFRTMPETIAFLERYAKRVSPPLQTHCPVTAVRRTADGYEVVAGQGTWHCKAVVLATGAFNIAQVPKLAEAVPSGIAQLTTAQYRNPESLEPGGVMVVGAAASGAQIADEIHRSGRPVTLAVGEHVRAPRTYRGRDIQWWMDATGLNDERYDQVENLRRARSLVLVPDRGLCRPPEHRSERAHVARGEARGPAGRRSGRQGPVLRIVAQSVRAGRPQAEPAAEHVRRVGRGERRERRGRSSASPRADARRSIAAARARFRSRRDQDDRLGDRVSPRLLLAGRPGPRPRRATSATMAAS